MTASPFLSHLSNLITSFPYNSSKPLAPLISSKYSFISFSISPANGRGSTKIEGSGVGYESEDSYTQNSESIPRNCSTIKAPTAPWMNEPLLVKPNEMESMRPRTKKGFKLGGNGEYPDLALTGKIGGGRGRLAMKIVFESLEKLEKTQNSEESTKKRENRRFKFATGALFGKGDCGSEFKIDENHEAAEESLETNEFDIPLSKVLEEVKLKKLPWKSDEKMAIGMVKKEKIATAAELSLDGVLLERLRDEAALIKKWVKVMKAGVTEAVVDQVRFIWRSNELALLKFAAPLCGNMDRAREIVEVRSLFTLRNQYQGS